MVGGIRDKIIQFAFYNFRKSRFRSLIQRVTPDWALSVLRVIVKWIATTGVKNDLELFQTLLSERDRSIWKSRRVVLVCGSLQPGGAERQVVNALHGLINSGISDVHLLCDTLQQDEVNRHDFYLPTALESGAEVRVIRPSKQKGIGKGALPNGFKKVYRDIHQGLAADIKNLYWEFKDLQPEIVHAWLDWSNVRAGLAAALAGVPRIILSGRNLSPGHFSLYQPYMDPAYKTLIPLSNVHLVNNSKAGAIDYAAWLGIDPDSIDVVYNGVRFDGHSRPTPEEITRLRLELRIPASAPVVGSIIRFSTEKRPMLWLEVASNVAKQLPDVYFVLFGEGSLRKGMESFVSKAAITDRVRLPGVTSASFTALAVMDVVLLTSSGEGNPNVALEAQWLGVPVVSSAAGGAPESIDHGRTGWIVDSVRAEAFAERVVATLADEEFRSIARAEGPSFVASQFSLDRMVRETLRVYGYQPTERV